MNDTQTQTLAELLHAAAGLVAAHPGIPAPYVTGITYDHSGESSVELNWFISLSVKDPAEQKQTAARILKAIGGKWDKDPDPDERFNFTQTRDHLSLKVQVEREAVCERVVTGVETVTIPAKPATEERTEEREVVEWRCEPLLAGEAESLAVAIEARAGVAS